MPVYEYACKACDHEFEREQRISDKPLKKCPSCGAMQAKRLISRTSFVLKGGGWYSDLYASPGKSGDDKEDGAKSDGDDKGDKSKSDGDDKGGKSKSGGDDNGGKSKSEGSSDAKSDKPTKSGSGKSSGKPGKGPKGSKAA